MSVVARRTPVKAKRSTSRRTRSARCSRQRCNRAAWLDGLCVSHAEQRADEGFSQFIRFRDGCCTAAAVLEGLCGGHLQAAHIVGRRNYAVRFDPANVHALCQVHHRMVDQHQALDAKYRWALGVLGCHGWDRLMQRARTHTMRKAAIVEAMSV